MAIKLYVGRMGSGKTYEVVTEVIYNALKRGRRVVSNIAGLNFDAMKAALLSEGVPEDVIGSLVKVPHEKVLEAGFWRTDESIEGGENAFIQPGDLLALDEIWRFWLGFGASDGGQPKVIRPPHVMNFFRMHRHFVNDVSGISCDVALITQDPLDLSRVVRSVVEETYYMDKLTAVGLSSRYRVDIFKGGKLTRKPLRSLQRAYNKDYFCFYESHSQKKEGGASAVEENIDSRGNVLKGMLFKVVLPISVPILLFIAWFLYGFFYPHGNSNNENEKAAVKTESVNKQDNKQDKNNNVVKTWRVVGRYEYNGVIRVVLTDGENSRYIFDPKGVKLTALSTEILLPEGGYSTSWTGVSSKEVRK